MNIKAYKVGDHLYIRDPERNQFYEIEVSGSGVTVTPFDSEDGVVAAKLLVGYEEVLLPPKSLSWIRDFLSSPVDFMEKVMLGFGRVPHKLESGFDGV